jgi:hypothetical protein
MVFVLRIKLFESVAILVIQQVGIGVKLVILIAIGCMNVSISQQLTH